MDTPKHQSIVVLGDSTGRPLSDSTYLCPNCKFALGNDGYESALENLEIGAKLNEGGFCEVYLGLHEGGIVAIKCPRGSCEDKPSTAKKADDEVGQRLIVEARVLKSLNHPNIIRVFAYRRKPPLMVMEYHKHGCLSDFIKRNPSITKKPGWILERTIEIVSAMLYFHRVGVFKCHGDLTAMNILISSAGKAIVCDFGLVGLAPSNPLYEELPDFDDRNLCRHAPEVIENKIQYEKGDVYQLGIIMYELLVRKSPFGDEENSDLGRVCLERDIIQHRRCPEIPDNLMELTEWHPVMEGYANLMKRCWSVYQDHRPNFAELKMELMAMHKEYEDSKRPPRNATPAGNNDDSALAAILALAVAAVALLAGSQSVFSAVYQREPAALAWLLILGFTETIIAAVVTCVLTQSSYFAAIDSAVRWLKYRFGKSAERNLRYHSTLESTLTRDKTSLLLRSPFDTFPSFLDEASPCNEDFSVLNLPIPSAEIWKRLRLDVFHDLMHQPQEPWRYQLHHLCTRCYDGCPTPEDWTAFKRVFLDNRKARLIRAWATYERGYNKYPLTGTEQDGKGGLRYPDEGPSNRMGNEEQNSLIAGDFFAARIGNDYLYDEENSGLSRTSTGVLTEGDWHL